MIFLSLLLLSPAGILNSSYLGLFKKKTEIEIKIRKKNTQIHRYVKIEKIPVRIALSFRTEHRQKK